MIYTPENPEYPVLDETLKKDIPAGITVLKTKVWEPYGFYKKFIGLKKEDKINSSFMSEKKKPKKLEGLAVWIRGNLFIPDARKFWIKPSIKYLSKYLNDNPVDAIVSTGPPHSMHLIALALKTKLNIPWLADFRDPWTQIDFYQDLKLTALADSKHKELEKSVLKNADEVVVISRGMKDAFNRIHARKYQVITNGFDEDDLPKIRVERDKKFSIAHIGTIAKSRNPESLWKVLKELTEKQEAFAQALEIKLIGKVDYSVTESLKHFDLEKYVTQIPYLTHDKVLEEQQRANVLLLIINNTPNAKMILTGKLFEYLSAGTPILCIGPEDGDAAGIIRETGHGLVAMCTDEKIIREQILKLFAHRISNTVTNNGKKIEKYSRKNLTQDICRVLDEMVGMG